MNNFNIKLMLYLTTSKKLLISCRTNYFDPLVDLNFARIRYRNGRNVIVIPASTLKGILRTSLIRISQLLGYGVKPSIYPSKLTGSEDIVCKLFGRPHAPPSKLFVKTAEVDANPSILTHVSIDDETRCSKEHALYTAEYLPINYTFKMKVEGKDLNYEEAEALFAALANLNFERVGKAGLIQVKIGKDESVIPEELQKNEVISEILGVLGY
ncbi:MAG: RAMP superfamily CRISPR-associated protein [Nitrososphaerales archaeon]